MTYRAVAPSSPISLHIREIGFSDDPAVTRFRCGRRETYIIHYVTAGRGFFNGTTVRAGEGFLITPGMIQEYRPDGEAPWEFYWIIASGDDMEPIFAAYRADPETGVFSYSYRQQVTYLRERIARMADGANSAFETLVLFLGLFNRQLREGGETAFRPSAETYAHDAAAYIETYYYRKLTVSEIARILGVSQPYLFRVFRSAYGKSPKQYLGDYRMMRAKTLLRESDLPVAAVAQSVGFDDPLSFSKFFSLREGTSPSRYRASGCGE